MEKKQLSGEYLAPEIKVKRLGARTVLCVSNAGFGEIQRDNCDWDNAE